MSEDPAQSGVYRRTAKRVIDTLMAGGALIVLSPLIALVAFFVWLRDGRPVIYVQTRPGMHERPFRLFKFRTMKAAPADGAITADALRLTTLGMFLRRWSLDELPQLVNVLRGEMSVVGPRPLLMHYLPYFTTAERKRFALRPGMTGWAQVHGRNALDWDRRLALDVWYVEHCSASVDARVILMTVGKVLSGHGVHVDQASVMEDFDEVRRAAAFPPQ